MSEENQGQCQCGERCSCLPDSIQRANCSCWKPGKSEPIKVFGLMLQQPSQEPLIQKHCFGDCGKVSMAGAIVDDTIGALMVCCETTCPWLSKEMTEPYGKGFAFGSEHDVYLRVLTDTPLATEAR